ncbi:hypothetical protein L861_12660 [Litchfieldella anticariensis FP35 = DSM 16096]|uniref:Uncharacterized protein n=1 Tax=Litchfieldella anticariensis (strain DSM 16096 / CECT 5854 / CIP 108499 / LMG 22089 / FP35) TaxID=1121939 RepID=S2KJQ2_LITA3|nr:hypothetical protein L861_12660 [Halomonas anticariensis FP35 = DSM 16096]
MSGMHRWLLKVSVMEHAYLVFLKGDEHNNRYMECLWQITDKYVRDILQITASFTARELA